MKNFNLDFYEYFNSDSVKAIIKERVLEMLNFDYGGNFKSYTVLLLVRKKDRNKFLDFYIKNSYSYVINWSSEDSGNFNVNKCSRSEWNKFYDSFPYEEYKVEFKENLAAYSLKSFHLPFTRLPKTFREKSYHANGMMTIDEKNAMKYYMENFHYHFRSFTHNKKYSKYKIKRFTKELNEKYLFSISVDFDMLKKNFTNKFPIPILNYEIINKNLELDFKSQNDYLHDNNLADFHVIRLSTILDDLSYKMFFHERNNENNIKHEVFNWFEDVSKYIESHSDLIIQIILDSHLLTSSK
ncbi:hypothetical protein [Flammeovirga kamogawensis]|nr:hypothetical protein [Flammeovirga kamogawensis]